MSSIKSVLSSIAIGVMVGIIIFEVIFAIKLYGRMDENQDLSVEIENGETEVLEFEKLGLIPGESVEYNFYLNTNDGATHNVKFEFSETDDSPLKDFVRVKLLVNDEEMCDELLADLLGGEDIVVQGDITATDEYKVTIVYYMPEEVGNEAANAEAWFNLYITAQFK